MPVGAVAKVKQGPYPAPKKGNEQVEKGKKDKDRP